MGIASSTLAILTNMIFKDLSENQERDLVIFGSKELPKGFSDDGLKAHNDEVIKRTIKKYNQTRKNKVKEWENQLGERVEAVAQYVTGKMTRTESLESYFGKNYLSYLRGKKIRAILIDRIHKIYRLVEG